MHKLKLVVLTLLLVSNAVFAQPSASRATDVWKRVEVIRTEHGVPHIRANDLHAAGYALAWVQLEDYGNATGIRLLSSSGRWASVAGFERIDADFNARRQRAKAETKYASLTKDVRDVYEGFAAGVNRFIELHPDKFPKGMPTDFTGFDVLA
ncbi:MAG TPA: penicillin acylase family protein, partial [Pyrinomonadaceae bacterium]|nr:penicillin acylase family protein [Pyrinomonadaceae bacterium]